MATSGMSVATGVVVKWFERSQGDDGTTSDVERGLLGSEEARPANPKGNFNRKTGWSTPQRPANAEGLIDKDERARQHFDGR